MKTGIPLIIYTSIFNLGDFSEPMIAWLENKEHMASKSEGI